MMIFSQKIFFLPKNLIFFILDKEKERKNELL